MANNLLLDCKLLLGRHHVLILSYPSLCPKQYDAFQSEDVQHLVSLKTSRYSIYIHSSLYHCGHQLHWAYDLEKNNNNNWHLRFFSKSTFTYLLGYNMPVLHILLASTFLLFNHRLLLSLADGTVPCMHSESGPIL